MKKKIDIKNRLGNLLSALWQYSPEIERRKRIFEERIELAQRILEVNPRGLNSLVRALGRSVQANGIQNVLNHSEDHQIPTLDFDNLFFDRLIPITACRKNAMDLMQHGDSKYNLSLSRDLVIPWPWNRNRITSALATIGFGKAQGAWEADFNHKVSLLLPFGMCFVYGGNHSISAGIINGEGRVVNSASIDITPIYSHVRFDGHVYRRTFDDSILYSSKPPSIECGAIFEIGRLMIENNILYDGQPYSSDSAQRSNDSGEYEIRYAVYKNDIKQLFDLTESAIAFHLNQEGIIEDSNQWNSIFRGETSIVINRFGRKEEYKFVRYLPKPLLSQILY